MVRELLQVAVFHCDHTLDMQGGNSAIQKLSNRYCTSDAQNNIKEGLYSLSMYISDSNDAHPLLLRAEMIRAESRSDAHKLRIAEKFLLCEKQDLAHNLLLPYGAGDGFDEKSINCLSPYQFRRVVRAAASIQQKAFTRNRNGVGPLLWWFGMHIAR